MTYAWYDILGTVGIRSHYNWVLLTGQRFRLFLAVDQGVGYEERIARGRQDAGVPTSVPFKTETELSQINGVAIDTALWISRNKIVGCFFFLLFRKQTRCGRRLKGVSVNTHVHRCG